MSISQSEGQHRGQRIPRHYLVDVFEEQALRNLKKHLKGKGDDATLEREFVAALKKSPSEDSIGRGIFLAVQVGWLSALEELLAVDTSTYMPFTILKRYPLINFIRSRFNLAHDQSSTFLDAIAAGKVEVVRIMTKYVDLNTLTGGFLAAIDHINVIKDQTARKQIIDIIVPIIKTSCSKVHRGVKYDIASIMRLLEEDS